MAVSQILFLMTIYLCDLYPRLPGSLRAWRRGPRLAAYLVLLPVGFAVPPRLLDGAVGSYPTVSTLLRLRGAVCFLWHFPSADIEVGVPGLRRASRPVESGLSSLPNHFGTAVIRHAEPVPLKELFALPV